MVNPFLVTSYISEEYFCNRKEETKLLKSNIANGRNTVIYGWRRLGKTSLIRHLEGKLGKNHEVLYVDLLGTKNLDDAQKTIGKAIFNFYGQKLDALSFNLQRLLSNLGLSIGFDQYSGNPEISVNLYQENKNSNSFESIGAFLSNRKKKVVIVLDEFQEINHYEDKNAEALFRAFMQANPMVRFIFSGSHRNIIQSMFLEKNRPFYKSCELLLLEEIELKEYTKFIKGHFANANGEIGQETIDEIYRWSRGQTYCIQQICNKLYDRDKTPDLQSLLTVKQETVKQETPILSTILNTLSKTQGNVLEAIAKEEPVTNQNAQAFLFKHKLGAASSVNTALKKLIESELVIKTQKGLMVHDVIFSQWLKSLI